MRRSALLPRALQVQFPVNPVKGSGAVFLWGPRQTGKTTYLTERFSGARFFDLLDSDVSAEMMVRPRTLREEALASDQKVLILDEIQKVPALLDEVHWLLENTDKKIILCGSSARKLKRQAHNLLGGRAVDYHLFPLVSREIPDFDLDRYLNHGGLPTHYLSDSPKKLLKAYVNSYIKEEIIGEAVTRNIPAFSRFLEVVGLTHGRLLNYANVAREAGVSPVTVRGYYQILKDTLLGYELEPWKKTRDRRLIETAKFYLFDTGVAHYLNPEVSEVVPGSDSYGRAFEHFLLNEVRAYLDYHDLDRPCAFWRTSSGFEVDLIVGDMELALEFKSSVHLLTEDLKSMRLLKEEYRPKRSIIVCRSIKMKKTEDGIEIMPWKYFCDWLWSGQIIMRN